MFYTCRNIVLGLGFSLFFSLSASAQALVSATHDPASDELILQVAYQGSFSNHKFQLLWDDCEKLDRHGVKYQIAARLVDEDGSDTGDDEQNQFVSFSLKDLKCRPSLLTVRIGRWSHKSLIIR